MKKSAIHLSAQGLFTQLKVDANPISSRNRPQRQQQNDNPPLA
jgi:hypothetical protein